MSLPKIIRRGEQGYRQCKTTIMDTTDPFITFDENGDSNWVRKYNDILASGWNPAGNRVAFKATIDKIKEEGEGKEYDCIIGLSGGVDSSYIVHLAKKEGLRPLIMHCDTGWNSELAVKNIEGLVKGCGFDLYTHVINWQEMADVQRAFLIAGVPNQDIPQDHAIMAAFFGEAERRQIRWTLSGSNFACESILPPAWGYDNSDLLHLKAIHKQFGSRPLGKFPTLNPIRRAVNFGILKKLNIVKILNFLPYNKKEAIELLGEQYGWRYYGGKHYESRWTRFFQGHYLPTKFGYDKRIAHLSSLIVSGQITKEEAEAEMMVDHYPTSELKQDKLLIQKKLGFSAEEFEELLRSPGRSHLDFPNSSSRRALWLKLRGK